ncbi:hypothetical protein ACJMK2_007369 [Sinanodonta woodiana]|uniref:LIM zinc-binding domain-containing protein n=1 Tax=Sinanodonta woodiana TaxID=1069815 RepID=A0ABD3VJX0_SINWO
MTQHGLERDFQHMGLHDHYEARHQSPILVHKLGTAAPTPYRPGVSGYRGFRDQESDFPPPPPQGGFGDSFPPPPSDPTKENIYHEIRDELPPPPPQISRGLDYGGHDAMHARTSAGFPSSTSYTSTFENRAEMSMPSGGGYERVIKQATYSVQSSDSSGRSSPYSNQYANLPSIQSSYNSMPSQQTYPYSSKPGNYGYSQQMSPHSHLDNHTDSAYQPHSPHLDNRASSAYTQSSSRLLGEDLGSRNYSSRGPMSEYTANYASPLSRSERPVPGPQVPVVTGSKQSSSPKSDKEAEVDALTNLLMQNMESTSDPDFFGMCSKCGKKVLGETNGCTAMDQIFHISCFVCVSCGTMLRGKSFYAMETKPYCESCYMNTLEKCSVCSKPVTDRLLRATGKPYHPACFVCVVCGKSLDGIPFTVDATNQIHCIEDFHKKFAPRCCVCQRPIMPEKGQEETVRVVAMDRSFHVQCYRCEDCGLLLSSEAEGRGCYPLDDHILCKNCNAKRIQALTTKMATEL